MIEIPELDVRSAWLLKYAQISFPIHAFLLLLVYFLPPFITTFRRALMLTVPAI
jgi:hypothetical protein